jgi:hypothetical protein
MCHCIGTFRKNCCFVAGTSLGVSLKNEHTLPKYFVVLLLVPLGRATAKVPLEKIIVLLLEPFEMPD